MKIKITKPVFAKEYFIFLLPLFFVFHGFVENYSFVSVPDAVDLYLFYLFILLVIGIISFFIFGSWRKAAVFSFLILSYNFFFGSLHDVSKKLIGINFLTSYKFILSFTLVLFILLIWFLAKTKRSFNRLTRFLNLLFIFFLIIDSGTLAYKLLFSNHEKISLPNGLSKFNGNSKPDIYLIIADEYAGQKELQDIFHYDNSSFKDALISRGFHYIEDTKSNYNFTPFSISSLLNYSYLKLDNPGHTLGEVPRIMEMIKNNNVCNFFLCSGYKLVNNSVFDLYSEPTATTQTFLPSKTKYITAQTFISRLERDISYNLITEFHLKWAIKNGMYSNLKNNELMTDRTIATVAASGKQPVFSYTHLMMPHYPYYYDENGSSNIYDSLFRRSDAKYLSYLKYSNKKFLTLIDGILKRSAKPPIIIFMSDHGYRNLPEEAAKQYDFINFCSVYLPNKDYDKFYTGMSNVNFFRILLNTQFEQHLPLLSDSTVFLKD